MTDVSNDGSIDTLELKQVLNSLGEFQEKENVAGIFGGTKTKLSWSKNAISLDWFEAKGKIEQLLDQLNLSVNWTKLVMPTNIFHPYKTSELYLNSSGKRLGIFGQISPLLSSQLNIDPKIYLFEFDFHFHFSKLHNYNFLC